MKKFIFGLLVGMALMLTGSVFAADIQSLIGKTIQGQFSVTVDGKQLEMPAIVVDGTSFLPVRSFGESVGYAVYFDPEGAVRLEKQIGSAQYHQERQAAYDQLKAEQSKQKTPEQLKEEEIQTKIKAEQDADAARKLESQKIYDAAQKHYQEETARANAASKAAQEATKQQEAQQPQPSK